MLGRIHSFESFGTVDGPGIRFVVFMQGCPLRCMYCHNPDARGFSGGNYYSSDDIVAKVLKYKSYFGDKGGITVTGGEPLSQIEFVTELFSKLKKKGVNTCLDTSGCVFNPEIPEITAKFSELIRYTDLVLLDIKEINEEKHKKLTGAGNKNILAFAKYLSENNIKMWIRYVLVPGITDFDEDLINLRKFIDGLKTVEKVEVLPYHTMGVFKYKDLCLDYPLEGVEPPTEERIKNAERIIIK